MKGAAFVGFGAACVVAILFATPGIAQDESPIPDHVTAESRFGHGSIEGKVRGTNLGPQVQLPSGIWIYCRRSCSETLRVETIDFFEANTNSPPQPGQGGVGSECGIFGCLDFNISR